MTLLENHSVILVGKKLWMSPVQAPSQSRISLNVRSGSRSEHISQGHACFRCERHQGWRSSFLSGQTDHVGLYVCAHLSKGENTALLEEWSSAMVLTIKREELRCWDALAGIYRKLNSQLRLTLAMEVSSFIQSFAFPKSAACSRYICVRRPGKNRHLSVEPT